MNNKLKQYGHTTLAAQLERLSNDKKVELQNMLEQQNFDSIKKLYDEVYVNREVKLPQGEIKDVETIIKDELSEEIRNTYKEKGLEAIRQLKIAPVLMAGGQGTRLEHPGPKGTFEFDGKSLFEFQAEQIIAYNETYNINMPWTIMTSDINHEETLAYFEAHHYFGMPKENITFFKQPNIVALSESGELLLNKEQSLLTTPNGNGGIFEALHSSGVNKDLKDKGVEYLYINNIDNVLVKVLDPMLCGLAVDSQSDVTTKTIAAKDNESVGRVIEVEGVKQVMEYTELPEGEENTYRNANIGIHIFKLDYLIAHAESELPYHLAIKNLEQLDSDLNPVKQSTLKFEKFYFDIFRYGQSFKTLQVDRASEFSPLKNKEGKDSVETARQDLINNKLL
ncbi:UTP--glucose-1-phosphate uridylyltransferase [Macrococcoides bohemicum]|uniref:UTP--glucose-1-phosphate uridylyltransferase n=1 Tax=Macrococcoides bohemicum TaxID=1903056 RepID=UPI00165DC8A7|nr:UTP--glucose-1-phosphate uridylyltransferase [Macrococcus bohemicus]MBC9874573.1 UTP--glucose-1-phosphate uridylyltransferase [Macrococcus bohemicus]QRN49060.1 UTP--glucose-1-phosphate uridylyltransferase [Macrococcus bohemicus]QYA45192.1 UTP--glucose-1-phosphate uridylyltransferase [Macrococcus bohemicus]